MTLSNGSFRAINYYGLLILSSGLCTFIRFSPPNRRPQDGFSSSIAVNHKHTVH
jgi:hypothetical protein